LGIDGEMRKNLLCKEDYDRLFEIYDRDLLPCAVKQQKEVLELVNTHERIALTCFEANPHFCHRSHLAAALSKRSEDKLEVRHL
jgi:uncharacterized protein (DUF488 family)